MPLFTATLFVVCSAFPLDEKITKDQQYSAFPLDEKIARVQLSNNYCATLEYNQGGTTGYVHLCDIPGEGIAHTCLICMHAHAGLVYPRFTSRICMQPYCSFFFTTTADTCIVANLPRCSTMPNTTPMSVTVRNRQHQVLFSATSSRPGKQLDS